MKRTLQFALSGCLLYTLLGFASSASAAGLDNFTLTRAVPADAMLVAHARDHDGREFVNKQFARVWEAVESQRFDKDLKRLMESGVTQSGGDKEQFEQGWQQLSDLAAGVHWGTLSQRESAFAMKLAPPFGAEFIMLMMPPKDRVADDFNGISAIVQHIVNMDDEDDLIITTEGEGDSVVHRISLANMPLPLSLTFARHKDVLMLGWGSAMPEQALALLRGEVEAEQAALAATPRFKAAFKDLPAPQDSLMFADLQQIMTQSRAFAGIAANLNSSQLGGPPTSQPTKPLSFLVPLVDECDIWDYVAEVATTSGMKTEKHAIAVLKPGFKDKALGKLLYSGRTLDKPLKYIPEQAEGVSVSVGPNAATAYDVLVDFVRTHVTGGPQLLAQWDAAKQNLPIDVEDGLLAWMGGEFTMFSAPIPTPFMPGWVFALEVRDEAKANETLAVVSEMLNAALAEQNCGVEDAKLDGAEGFKRVIVPPMFAMVPGLGRPIYGIKDGHLFVANGPEVLQAALQTAAGSSADFSANERFKKEGLPIGGNTTSFSFQDLTKWGEGLSQALAASAFGARMALQEQAKNPMVQTGLFLLTKAGNVVKRFDFYSSQCSVVTFEGNVEHTHSVVHYKKPPSIGTEAGKSDEESEGA